MCKHVATMPPAFLAQSFGRFPTGPSDSVLDVPGAGWGTRRSSATMPTRRWAADRPNRGDRRGPGGDVWASPVPAGVAVLNGAGELTGSLQMQGMGVTETRSFSPARCRSAAFTTPPAGYSWTNKPRSPIRS